MSVGWDTLGNHRGQYGAVPRITRDGKLRTAGETAAYICCCKRYTAAKSSIIKEPGPGRSSCTTSNTRGKSCRSQLRQIHRDSPVPWQRFKVYWEWIWFSEGVRSLETTRRCAHYRTISSHLYSSLVLSYYTLYLYSIIFLSVYVMSGDIISYRIRLYHMWYDRYNLSVWRP